MACLKCTHYIYLRSANWKMTGCPSSATRQSINHSTEQDREFMLRSLYRLSCQVLVISLFQFKLAAWAASTWVNKQEGETERAFNNTCMHTVATVNLAGCDPSWTISGYCFSHTHPPTASGRSVVSSTLQPQEPKSIIFHRARDSDTVIAHILPVLPTLVKIHTRAARLGCLQVLRSEIFMKIADNANGSRKVFLWP